MRSRWSLRGRGRVRSSNDLVERKMVPGLEPGHTAEEVSCPFSMNSARSLLARNRRGGLGPIRVWQSTATNAATNVALPECEGSMAQSSRAETCASRCVGGAGSPAPAGLSRPYELRVKHRMLRRKISRNSRNNEGGGKRSCLVHSSGQARGKISRYRTAQFLPARRNQGSIQIIRDEFYRDR